MLGHATRPSTALSNASPMRAGFLRALARHRRWLVWAVLLAPPLLVVATDMAMRGDRLVDLSPKYVASYSAAALQSAALWTLLLLTASAKRGLFRWISAAAFVLFAGLAVGGQLYFHRQYSTYLNLDATLFGTSLSDSLFGQLRADSDNFLTSVVPPLLVAAALVWMGRIIVRPRRRPLRFIRPLVPIVVLLMFVIPCSYRTVQASTPDVIYFHAIGGLIQKLTGVRDDTHIKPGLRHPPALAPVTPNPPAVRNVLFVLSESLRADVHCSEYRDACPNAPRVNAALPDRFPLVSMRSNSSTTAIQLAVLWSGLQPTDSREALHSAPLLFEYAEAGGIASAYWSSHHMMFANSRLYVRDLPTQFQCGATELDPLADIDTGAHDELLTERIIQELPQLEEPFFAVAHFGNTHVPYIVDENDAPFQPSRASKAPEDNEAYRNYYKNAVYRQDKAMAGLLEFVKASSFGQRTVIVFTADHGEAFREHDQLGHTGSLYEEEILVPAWIHAPPGALTDEEQEAVVSWKDQPVFHTDVAPTVLDLMGLYEAEAFEPYVKEMVGRSLLRPMDRVPTLALSNCSGIWGCAFRNWGVMRGTLKLHAREWDTDWRCFDVQHDPMEQNDLGPSGCGDLVSHAEAIFGGLPSDDD